MFTLLWTMVLRLDNLAVAAYHIFYHHLLPVFFSWRIHDVITPNKGLLYWIAHVYPGAISSQPGITFNSTHRFNGRFIGESGSAGCLVILLLHLSLDFAFNALTSLIGWQERHPVCKILSAAVLMVVIWLELCTSQSSGCHCCYIHHLVLQQNPG